MQRSKSVARAEPGAVLLRFLLFLPAVWYGYVTLRPQYYNNPSIALELLIRTLLAALNPLYLVYLALRLEVRRYLEEWERAIRKK